MREVRRMCRICRTKKPKTELTRWVEGPAGLIQDDQQRLPGRGIYSCSPECTNKLTRIKVKR